MPETSIRGHVTKRDATEADLPFLLACYESARADEMAIVPWSAEEKQAFLGMQFHAQHTYYHAQFPDAQYQIIELDGVPIGRIYVDTRSNEIKVLEITVLAAYRGKGIGSMLIREVMGQGAELGLPVRLHVESFNPARRLYDRLGYNFLQDDGVYQLLEWTPNTVPSATKAGD